MCLFISLLTESIVADCLKMECISSRELSDCFPVLYSVSCMSVFLVKGYQNLLHVKLFRLSFWTFCHICYGHCNTCDWGTLQLT